MANDMMTLLPYSGALLSVIALIWVAFYVYMALALMYVAKRLNDPQPWLAWIPIANLVLLARLAKMHWWPVLLLIAFIIPILNFIAMFAFVVYVIIWQWKICEARNRPGWWVILQFVPFIGGIWTLVMWGILAWSEE
jgi:hypothetical protein